jgi:hypothetical protein
LTEQGREQLNEAFDKLDELVERWNQRLTGFAPKFDPAPELQNLHTNYERLLRQTEDFQQPVGNRVRQKEDKVRERQGSYHHRNHGLSLFPS